MYPTNYMMSKVTGWTRSKSGLWHGERFREFSWYTLCQI